MPNIVYFDTARFFFIEYMYRTEYATDLVTYKCSSVIVYVYPLSWDFLKFIRGLMKIKYNIFEKQ